MRHLSRPPMLLPLLLATMLPLAAAAAGAPGSIRQEISADLAEARREVRTELAEARRKLDTDNLELGDLCFGDSDKPRANLPKAEITPDGDFLVEGRTVTIDAAQRRDLLAYRGQVLDVARAGIDIGEQTAQAALEAVDRGLFSLMFSALTGSLERRIEKTVMENLGPAVEMICASLPALYDTQQRLAISLAEFRPYATLEPDSAKDCRREMQREFARR